jgi:hypothetical protein
MAVRSDDERLQTELDAIIARKGAALTQILRRAGIPLLPPVPEEDSDAKR